MSIQRELGEKRVRAVERKENKVAMAKQEAEEQRASAEAKRAPSRPRRISSFRGLLVPHGSNL